MKWMNITDICYPIEQAISHNNFKAVKQYFSMIFEQLWHLQRILPTRQMVIKDIIVIENEQNTYRLKNKW